jgi:DNA-binding IclR family transcriptional regulator
MENIEQSMGQAPPLTDKSATSGAQAIRRAVELLRTVAQIQRSGASLSRIVKASGLSTSTAHRILRSLAEERLLRHDEATRSYHIGPLAFELGLAVPPELQVMSGWRSATDAIARESRLTTYLMARSGNEAVCLHCVQGSTAMRAMPMDVGQRLPLGIGAGSLAILASLDDAEIAHVLEAQQSRRATFPRSPADPEHIWQRIAFAREHGFSVSRGSVTPGVVGVGMAIVPGAELIQLAISVSAVANTIEAAEAQALAATIARAIHDHEGR